MFAFAVPCFGIAFSPVLATQPSAASIHAAIAKALPPLLNGANGHIEKKSCFACHNQTFPVMAFAAAKERGFDIPTNVLPDQIEHITDFITDRLEEYRSGKGTGGQVNTAGSILFTLEHAGAKPGDATTAVVEYLLKTQPQAEFWKTSSNRPPTEASHFTATYLAVRGLQTWATEEQRSQSKTRIATAKKWLLQSTPRDTEDRVFRLMGIVAVKADRKAVAAAAFELLATQRRDGGWAQVDSMESDSYATATSLVALREAGLPETNPAYRTGLAYLIKTQRKDGTWLIASRSKPFQPYYESGFPHGKNQFISATASGWATTALVSALPKRK
jgi:hypothetical protein